MPRRKVLRFLKTRTLDPQVIEKYLVHYNAHELYLQPGQFPPISPSGLFASKFSPEQAGEVASQARLSSSHQVRSASATDVIEQNGKTGIHDGPLELEIGCGSGEYLCDLAQKDPSAYFVGVDRSMKALSLGIELAAELGLENIKFIAGDFRQLYPLLEADSLRAVYLHFPEPYNKPRMRRQHIFNATLLDQLYRALQAGGLLSVVSDNEALFMKMLVLAERDQRFVKVHDTRYIVGFETEVKSRFQRIWEGHAIVPLRFLLRKV